MEKKFDCLKMKEEIQAKIYEETKDMTFPELRAYLDKNLENSSLWQKLVNRDNAQKQNMNKETIRRIKEGAQSITEGHGKRIKNTDELIEFANSL